MVVGQRDAKPWGLADACVVSIRLRWRLLLLVNLQPPVLLLRPELLLRAKVISQAAVAGV